MASVRFSVRAESDLLAITSYTMQRWGRKQAVDYIEELENCCLGLAWNPTLGRTCDHIRSGLRRFEIEKHVIFYRQVADGIVVSRILHQRMLPENHTQSEIDRDQIS